MSTIGFNIITDIQRPEETLVQRLGALPVANIADCMNRFFCFDTGIKMMNKASGVKMSGSAFTVKTRPNDNLMVHKALDIAAPGDVLVIDAGGETSHAILGEIMILMAKNHKLSGLVIDGCCRDYEFIQDSDFPVFARGVNPQGPYKDGPGEINTTVSCGGVVVSPGDIIIGDADGAVVVPFARAEEIAAEAETVLEKEERVISELLKGNNGDRSWVDRFLSEKGCRV